tara:strand:- start:4513 stop:4710 length:198 start_codon:yes stop_codon:yes gene_type:complete
MNADESDKSRALCWVNTKFGRFKAEIVLETTVDKEIYIIVDMLDDQFTKENKTQKFKKQDIEYIN